MTTDEARAALAKALAEAIHPADVDLPTSETALQRQRRLALAERRERLAAAIDALIQAHMKDHT